MKLAKSGLKYFLLSLIILSSILSSKAILAADNGAGALSLNLDESEVKEEVARSLGVNAQQIEVTPRAIEYVKAKDDQGIGLKGRMFITLSVKDLYQTNGDMSYTSPTGLKYTSEGTNFDGSADGQIKNTVKIGYQVFENLGVEAGYEKSSSTIEVSSSSSSSGGLFGNMNSSTTVPTKIQNDFQTLRIGLVTNANLVDGKSYRMDLVGSVNGGVVMANSTYKTDGDVYNGAIGYSYGAEAGIRVIHQSGFFVQTGVGINNKVLAPKTWQDGSSTQFNESEKYVYVNVGYSFGGKRR